MTDLSHNTRELRSGDSYSDAAVGTAVRTGLGFASAAVLFLVIATVWVGTCTGSTADAVACGAPQRAALELGPTIILIVGGVFALVRGYRTRRDNAAWWVWLASAWFLLALAALSVVM